MEYEGEFSNFLGPNMANEMPNSCTQSHTCNPAAGPDALLTDTCFHMHTKTVSAAAALTAGETGETNSELSKWNKKKKQQQQQKPLGNREAVRKYREKKKALAASMEDEVVKLRILNQQLLTMYLECKTSFEAEIERYKCLLADIRGRIEVGIGSFGSQNLTNLPNLAGEYVQYNDPSGTEGTSSDGAAATSYQGFGIGCCGIENLPCMANSSSVLMEFPGCGRCGKAASTVEKQPYMASMEF